MADKRDRIEPNQGDQSNVRRDDEEQRPRRDDPGRTAQDPRRQAEQPGKSGQNRPDN